MVREYVTVVMASVCSLSSQQLKSHAQVPAEWHASIGETSVAHVRSRQMTSLSLVALAVKVTSEHVLAAACQVAKEASTAARSESPGVRALSAGSMRYVMARSTHARHGFAASAFTWLRTYGGGAGLEHMTSAGSTSRSRRSTPRMLAPRGWYRALTAPAAFRCTAVRGQARAIAVLRSGNTMTMRPVIASLLVLAVGPGCACNLLTNPDSVAAAAPQSADVAIGASHDVLVVACQEKLTLLDLLAPVVSTAVFVGLGRLDAAFYLPDAVAAGANPKCKDTVYSVSGATLDGDAFELETTQNDKAYKLHARRAGESTFRARVQVGGKTHDVSSTFRAWKPDRIELAPRCDPVAMGVEQLAGWVPAGSYAPFTHRLFSGMTSLTGYGFVGVSHPRVTFAQSGAEVSGTFTAERGPLTVTSEVDPAFMLQLTTYDATDYDRVALERAGDEAVFVGSIVSLRTVATIQGRVPCVSRFQPQLTVETPAVCQRKDQGPIRENYAYPLEIEALTTGTCRVSLALAGSTLTPSVQQFTVHRGFDESIAVPESAQHVSINLLDMWPAGAQELHLVGWKDEISGRLESITWRRVNGAWGSLGVKNPPRTLVAVDGDRATGTVVAVGSRGTGAQWNGTAWTPFDAGVGDARLEAVWVGGANDVWAAGEDGVLTHFDGTQWTSIDAGARYDLSGLWGDRDGGVYVVGGLFAKRWNGAGFEEFLPASVTDAGFSGSAVEGSAPNDLWVLGSGVVHRWNGATWSRLFIDGSTRKLWPVGDGHAYALVTRGSGSSRPTFFLARIGGPRTVYLPVGEGTRAITGWGNDVYVLTRTKLLRYRHDPADVFQP